MEKWQILQSEKVFSAANRFDIFKHTVCLPEGRIVDDFYYAQAQDFVVIFAQTKDDKIIVERQYKHGTGKIEITLPAGLIEKDEEPILAAQRELREETGYSEGTWTQLGTYTINGNQHWAKAHIFRVKDVDKTCEPDSGDLEDMEIRLVSLEELIEFCKSGAMSIISYQAAVALATNPLFNFNQQLG